MTITTPGDLIGFALRATGVLGVGQSALPEDYSDAFSALNGMIGQWNRNRWVVYHLVDYSVTSTGALYYTIGPGGDIDITARPDRIESAFFRQVISSQPNQVDYPLELIEAREDYNLIALKSLSSWPAYLFYDSAYPLGKLYAWPVPQASIFTLHFTIKETFSQFAFYTQPINLPAEYIEPLWSNLALRLGMIYPGVQISDDLRGLARASLQTIRSANTQIPTLGIPAGMSRPPLYNIYSDTVY